MISNLSAEQLRRAASIQEQIETLQTELEGLLWSSAATTTPGKRGMSAAGKARIAAAQKARWAKLKGKEAEKPTSKGRRKMSSAARAKIAAAARKRWAKAKAAGKNSL